MEKEVKEYVSKIGNIKEKIKNIIVEVEIKDFDICELEDTISIYMKVSDETGSINALLISERDNEEVRSFIDSINSRKKIKDVINCQIRGNISIIDKDMYDNLNTKNFKFQDVQIGTKLLVIKSIKNIGLDFDTLFGKNLFYLYECEMKELYQLIKDNTNYLDNIDIDKIKDIQIVNKKDICILFKSGIVQFNKEKLFYNILCLWFNCGDVYAISENKQIIPIHCNHDIAKYLNNDNYKYKKIIIDELSITVLTYDGEIKTYGFRIDTGIDYKRFYNVDDIGYDLNDNEVVVIQNEKVKSLFVYSTDKLYDKEQIVLSGKGKNDNNYYEII